MARERPAARVNEEIRAHTVRLVDRDGNTIGVTSFDEAFAFAHQAGLDLVEIAPHASPPVCQAVSFAQWTYQRQKAARSRRTPTVVTKEFRFSVRIAPHDFNTKCAQVLEALQRGHQVRCVVPLRGREASHPELATAVIERVRDAAAGAACGEVRREPGRVSCIFRPASCDQGPSRFDDQRA